MRPQDLAAAIIQVVGQSDDGVSVEALQRAFPDVARRTLQRYLARLSSDGKLIPVGRARARVYRLSTAADRTACLPGPVFEQLHRMGRPPVTDRHAQRIKHMQLTELDPKDVETLHAAKLAAQQLYIPGLQEVGASIRTRSGATFSAVHFEASTGFATICGEVATMACMIAAGHRDLEAIAAVWRDSNGDFYLLPPCGRCRELIYDLNASAWVIVSPSSDHWHKSAIEHPAKVPIKELLPMKSHVFPYLREEER